MQFISSLMSLLVGAALAHHTPTQNPPTKLRFPIDRPASPLYYNYVDHDLRKSPTGKWRDPAYQKNYYCKSDTTYDQHGGTDINAGYGTPIYASLKGGLYYRYDACKDSGFIGDTCGGGFGNHVKIDHEGSFTDGQGWTTIYGHMKSGSPAGYSTVNCGAKVGEVASSGSSNANHVHFEVRKDGKSYDPFNGSCSATNMWVLQNGTPVNRCG